MIKQRLLEMKDIEARFVVQLGLGQPEVLIHARVSSPTLEVLTGVVGEATDSWHTGESICGEMGSYQSNQRKDTCCY